MNKKYCKYCNSTKRTSHLILHIEYYVLKIAKPLSNIIQSFEDLFFKTKKYTHDNIWFLVLDFLYMIKLINFIDQPDESKINNRSLIFFKEAKKQGLEVQAIKFFFGNYTNEFRLNYKGKRYYYESIPLTIFKKNFSRMDDKDRVKRLLQKHDMPVAQGKFFTDTKKAFHYGQSIGFPLVVKPVNGSLSEHVTCFIKSDKELLKAIKIAKTYQPGFIVERHFEGNLYRITVVGRKYVFVCQKDKANVIGDGSATIKELIERKNSHKFRGDIGQKNTTLYKIPINDIVIHNLQDQGLNLQSVLPINKKIYVQDKFILSHGCDIINCSDDDVHIDNKNLCLKIADIFDADLLGIDILCPRIDKSYKEQRVAILETNSLPYIDMHQYPSHGKSKPVAEIVWYIVLSKLK